MASANAENPGRGRAFENFSRRFFGKQGLELSPNFSVLVGVASEQQPHRFDLGCGEPPTLIECKRHTWTKGRNAPSAKLSVWNEAMLFFLTAPHEYRKILVVLRDLRKGESLAEHYVKRYSHLVPKGVEIWELDVETGSGQCVHVGS